MDLSDSTDEQQGLALEKHVKVEKYQQRREEHKGCVHRNEVTTRPYHTIVRETRPKPIASEGETRRNRVSIRRVRSEGNWCGQLRRSTLAHSLKP